MKTQSTLETPPKPLLDLYRAMGIDALAGLIGWKVHREFTNGRTFLLIPEGKFKYHHEALTYLESLGLTCWDYRQWWLTGDYGDYMDLRAGDKKELGWGKPYYHDRVRIESW